MFYLSYRHCYPIRYYEPTSEKDSVELNEYSNSVVHVATATFKLKKIIYSNTDMNSEYWEKYNGTLVAPVFRREYLLWNSSREYVESNIYIERGNASAIDRHLRLGEVASFEALENYNNGYFKIK